LGFEIWAARALLVSEFAGGGKTSRTNQWLWRRVERQQAAATELTNAAADDASIDWCSLREYYLYNSLTDEPQYQRNNGIGH
jgi:hypothetical protein